MALSIVLTWSVVVLAGLLVFLVVVALVMGWQNLGTNAGFLEWDPHAMSEWREDLEDNDAPRMLALHNAQRRSMGKPNLTMNEYMEQLRRQQG